MLEFHQNQINKRERPGQVYDLLYGDVDIVQLPSFYMWAIRECNLKPHMKLLDVACGRGDLVYWGQKEEVVALGNDISSAAIRQGRQLFANLPLVVANGQALPYAENTFDIVSSMGSLEHYEDMALGVREIARVVKPEGKALILVPNIYSLLTNMLFALRNGDTSWDDQPIQRYGARKDWERLFESNGLSVTQIKKYERVFPVTWCDWKWYLQYPKQMIRLLMQPIIPVNWAFCFLFFCQKRKA